MANSCQSSADDSVRKLSLQLLRRRHRSSVHVCSLTLISVERNYKTGFSRAFQCSLLRKNVQRTAIRLGRFARSSVRDALLRQQKRLGYLVRVMNDRSGDRDSSSSSWKKVGKEQKGGSTVLSGGVLFLFFFVQKPGDVESYGQLSRKGCSPYIL